VWRSSDGLVSRTHRLLLSPLPSGWGGHGYDGGCRSLATSHPQPTPPSHQPWRPNPGGSLAQLEVLKVREAAAILRVGHNQLYQSVARGELPAVRIGRTIRIPKAALADLLTTVPEPVAPAAAPE
jgi:excisionase family DNA binding protein